MTWEMVPEGPRGPGSSRRRSPVWALFAVGAVLVVLGLALLIWPFFAASWILAALVGAACIANGIAAIVGARSRGVGMPVGILLLVLGVIAIAFPKLTVQVLVSFMAMTMLLVGIVWLLIALGMRRRMSWVFVAIPAVVVVLGILALVWPGVALTLAALAAGVVTLLVGGSAVVASLALRRPQG